VSNAAQIRTVPAARGLVTLGAVLALGAIWHGQGAFHKPSLHLSLWDSISVTGLCAIGECLVILGGGIDLSVGAVLALCGTAFAGLMVEGGWPWPLAAVATVLLGTAVGAANGTLVSRFRLQPFLVTLATMVIARGLARFLPELAGKPAGAKFMPADALGPSSWHWLSGRTVLDLPVSGLLFAAAAVLVWTGVRRTVLGRHVLALGGNEEAARLSGVATAAVKTATYAACGALAALAGICTTARDLHGNPGAGELLELQAIAAVVVGGTSLQGGRGGIGLAVLGVFTIGYIEKVLSINGVAHHWRLVIQGCIILAAVLFQTRRTPAGSA
jgi:ribose transport system permease protein